MNAQERERYAVLLSGLAETLGQSLTVGRISGHLVALDDVPYVYLEAAMAAALKAAKFVPSPGEIRELAEEAAEAEKRRRALPGLEISESEKRRIAASYQGHEDEVRQLVAALPKPLAERLLDMTGVERRMKEWTADNPDPIAQEGAPSEATNQDSKGG